MAEHVKKKFPKVFSGGVGCFKGTVHIDIQKDAQPYKALPEMSTNSTSETIQSRTGSDGRKWYY